MVNWIGIVSWGSNKGLSSRFCEDYRVWQEIPEEGWKIYRPKRCEYNNKDEVNNLKIPITITLFILRPTTGQVRHKSFFKVCPDTGPQPTRVRQNQKIPSALSEAP